MAKGKSSAGGARNDSRANGKAAKKHPGRRGHGSKSVALSSQDKILMGKGLYVKFVRMNQDGVRQMAGKRNRRSEGASED